jgi:hypothetical protein
MRKALMLALQLRIDRCMSVSTGLGLLATGWSLRQAQREARIGQGPPSSASGANSPRAAHGAAGATPRTTWELTSVGWTDAEYSPQRLYPQLNGSMLMHLYVVCW